MTGRNGKSILRKISPKTVRGVLIGIIKNDKGIFSLREQSFSGGNIVFHEVSKIDVENELPYHEWFVEFENEPEDLEVPHILASIGISSGLRTW